MAERLVIIKGDGPEWLIDLDKNPELEKRVELGELKIVKELVALPPDPWAEPAKKDDKQAEAALAVPTKSKPAKADKKEV